MNSFRAQKNQSNSLILYILPIRLSRKKKWFDRTSLAIRTNNIFYDHNWAGPSLIWNFNLSFFSLKKQSDSLMLRLMFDQTNFLWKIIFWERFTKSTVSIVFFSIKVPYIWSLDGNRPYQMGLYQLRPNLESSPKLHQVSGRCCGIGLRALLDDLNR